MKNMKKWNYTYYYPEQKQFCSRINASDKHLIARKMGVSVDNVRAVCAGRRKLQPEMKAFITKLLSIKKQMESIEVEPNN